VYVHLTGINDDPKSFIIRSADETQLNITSRCELASLRVENTKASGDATAVDIVSPFSAIVLRNVEVHSASVPGVNRAIRVGTTTTVTLIDCKSVAGSGTTQRALYTTGSVDIFGGDYDSFAGGTAIESASGGLFLYQLPRIRDAIIGADSGWYVNIDKQIVDGLDGYQEFDGRSSAAGTPTTDRGRIYFDAATKEFYQVDDTGAAKSLANASGAPDDAEYYVKSLHAGLSAEIVPPLDEFKASKLRQLDDGGDAVVADNNGNLRLIDHALIFDSGNGDWIITNGSNEVAWVLNTNTRGLLTPTGIVLTGAGQNLRGISDNVPDLGTTTAAEKLGNIYQAATKDIFPSSDEAGLYRRAVTAMQFAPGAAEDDFDGSVLDGAWTVAGAPFVTPTIGFGTPSSMTVSFGTINNRAFIYRGTSLTVPHKIRCSIIGSGVGFYVGYRWDDGSDNNYVEMVLRNNAAAAHDLVIRHRTGGGGVTVTSQLTITQPQWNIINAIAAGTFWSNWNGYMQYSLNSPAEFVLQAGLLLAAAWTATRRGIIISSPAAGATWETAYVDWVT
jgi:hypothetical protein